jgi:hypothetical protein
MFISLKYPIWVSRIPLGGFPGIPLGVSAPIPVSKGSKNILLVRATRSPLLSCRHAQPETHARRSGFLTCSVAAASATVSTRSGNR